MTTESIVRQLDEYLEPLDALESAGRAARNRPHRELIDLLVRDDTRPRLLQLLEDRLAVTDDADSGALLDDLADFAKPAMAAEVWGHQTQDPLFGQTDDFEHRQHIAEQYLLVGVPQMAEGALARRTSIDRRRDGPLR